MAFSTEKDPGLKDSLLIGSAEDFEIRCDPCKFIGQITEAKGFCVNCQENLCKACFDAHKKTRACRHHQLLNQAQKITSKADVSSDDSKICTEFCKTHSRELIKFFCSQHASVGCSDCMTLDHRTCRIDYIPDICSGVLSGREFGLMRRNVSRALKDAELMKQKAHEKKDENKENLKRVTAEIENFQKKLNNQIEKLKQNLTAEADSHKSKQDQYLDEIGLSCAKISSELQQIEMILQNCEAKQLEAQAFITMKQAQHVLNATSTANYERELRKQTINIVFKPKKEVENILFKPDGLGSVSTFIQKTSDPISLVHQNDINVRTTSDKKECWITGCSVTSADRLLLADCNNDKLKVVNIDKHSVVEEMTVDGGPYDITVLPEAQAAVTLPWKYEILILRTTTRLATVRSMHVNRSCYGIVYHQDFLYVVCWKPYSLLVLDKQGNVLRDISIHTALDQKFSCPRYLALNKDEQTLYINDQQTCFVASLTLDGKATGVYKHDELVDPRKLSVLNNGSLLVCCRESGTVHHVSSDLKHGCTVIKDVPKAQSICFHKGRGQVFVSDENNIRVFNVQ